MTTIVTKDAYGNNVQFNVDGQPIGSGVATSAAHAFATATGISAINASGDLTVGASLTVTTTSTLEGAVDCDDALNVDGAATFGSTLAVTGASTLTGNVSAAGTLAVTGASTLTGNVSAGGTLAVTGATTLAAVTASGLATVGSAKLDTGTKTATATSGAATLNKSSGIITSEALTTAAGSDYTLTLTNSTVAAGDLALVSIDSNGTAGLPLAYSAKCTSNTLTVIVRNIHASAAFNAAIKIGFAILKA